MGFWDLFKKKKQPVKRRRKRDSKVKEAFDKVARDVSRIRSEQKKHKELIEKNSMLIKKHSTKLRSLESIVKKEPISQVIPQKISQKISPTKPQLVATKLATGESILEIDNFSEQEKKIIGVFLGNKDMALSYVDIAKSLGKSHNTIKNQISTMNLKSDIFERSIKDKRNRFKLKPGLKIEKSID